jgi:trimeric autotransporter adhesin
MPHWVPRPHVPRRPRRSARRALAAVVVPAVLVSGMVSVPAGAQTPPANTLGRTPDQAAVSCWDIKQKDRAAPDGAYWLLTPAMDAPEQFHCDMTHDGGGWVLIGRGREGWRFSYNGQGSPAQVRSPIDGPDAFQTRTLAAPVVDGLLNGGRVDQLTDGVRVRRAVDTSGATRQEARFAQTKRDRWVWSFDAEHPVGAYRFDGATGSGGQTNNFGRNQLRDRIDTRELESHGWTAGWGYGTLIVGSNSPTSYLYSRAGEGSALPFSQVYVRPRLTAENTTFPAIGDEGLPADAQRPLLSNYALPTVWGVTGSANGRTGELNTEAQAFTQAGNRMIVGGNFRHVQRNQAGAGQVQQSYLAAFDVNTGEWLSDFRPTLNGQVKDLITLPNGRILAGGEFTQANGTTAVGVVALDPVTGAVDPSFTVAMENRLSGGSAVEVRAFDIQGDWLYLGGRFTHLAGGTRATPVYARMAARVAVADGTPDPEWNPNFSGTVVDLDASDRGDRVYFAGYFKTAGSVTTNEVAVISTAPGAAVVPNLHPPRFSNSRAQYQQAIREVDEMVWYGGSEHNLFGHRRSDFLAQSGNITKQGGDFQTINAQSGVVYGGCHCGNWNYQQAWTWSNVGTGWTQADNIRFVGAWDPETGQYLPEFVPGLNAARGHGPWDMVTDSNGVMWMGGDFNRAEIGPNQWNWTGGFVRYAERDSTAPSTPGGFAGNDFDGTTSLTWGPSTDDRPGAITYEILRGDRVIAATGTRTADLPTPDEPTRWFVRAVDAAGNRSATSPVLTVTPGQQPPPDEEPPPDEDPPPYATLGSWSGSGDVWDLNVGGATSVEEGGTFGERLRVTQVANEPAYVAWNRARVGGPHANNSLRWVSTFSGFPSTSFTLAQGLEEEGWVQRWRIDLTPAGRVRIRNGVNTLVAESPQGVPVDTELRFEAVREGSTMTVSVYSPVSSTEPLTTVTGTVGQSVSHVRVGQILRNPTVPPFTIDEVLLTDHAGEIGAPTAPK